MRLLLVEDDLILKDGLERSFVKSGYAVDVICDGEGANKLLTYQEYDVIVLDLGLPKLSGFELRKKIYINESLNLKCIPYLFFTTTSSQKNVIEAYSQSVQGFFVKANDFSKLAQTIKKIVEYWQECEAPNFTPE